MKQKIAILTQPLGHNYGGIIQNYALQKVLRNLGAEPITINRRYNKNYRAQLKTRLYHLIKNTGYKSFSNNVLKNKIYRQNYSFIKKHLVLSENITSNKSMKRFMDKHMFDVYVVGSDQTWRPKYSPNIYNYYLDFLEGKETKPRSLAYATSFGTDVWEYTEEQTQRVKKLVKQFDVVSVREESGVDLCRNFLNVNVQHVLDPTLLLNRTDYVRLLNLADNNTGKGKLFTYVLDNDDNRQLFLDSCAQYLGLEMFNSQSLKKADKFKKGDALSDYVVPPLENWLAGFLNSKFVITDSFHGTVFSIIFQKPFISIVNQERGASRFRSLLSKLGIESRLVESMEDFTKEMMEEPIDYIDVNRKLEELKQDSLTFLTNALS